MDSSQCPCFSDEPHGIQYVGEAFRRHWFKSKSPKEVSDSVARWHPDGATSAILNIVRTCGQGKPDCGYGEFSDLQFEDMVEFARYRLFVEGGLKSRCTPSREELPLVHDAEILLEKYRHGQCIDCSTLIRDAEQDGEHGKKRHRLLRSLLAQFDLNGQPLPPALRSWSAESRFQRPPPLDGRRPRQNWIRDLHIIHTVAQLCFMTARDATHNADRSKLWHSPLGAVARAFQQDRSAHGISYNALRSAWLNTEKRDDGRPVGPALLESWRTQDSAAS